MQMDRQGESLIDTGQSGAMQSAAAVALMPLLIFFATYTVVTVRTYTAAVTHNAFQSADWTAPKITPCYLGIWAII